MCNLAPKVVLFNIFMVFIFLNILVLIQTITNVREEDPDLCTVKYSSMLTGKTEGKKK